MVVSTPFDYFIMLLIVLNTLLLMMKVYLNSIRKSVQFYTGPTVLILFFPAIQYHGQNETYSKVIIYINMVFTGLFTIEAILKIFGFGPKVCTQSYSNELQVEMQYKIYVTFCRITSKMPGMCSISLLFWAALWMLLYLQLRFVSSQTCLDSRLDSRINKFVFSVYRTKINRR